jgi:hypothetical protein
VATPPCGTTAAPKFYWIDSETKPAPKHGTARRQTFPIVSGSCALTAAGKAVASVERSTRVRAESSLLAGIASSDAALHPQAASALPHHLVEKGGAVS